MILQIPSLFIYFLYITLETISIATYEYFHRQNITFLSASPVTLHEPF